jgi:hypothetical protein
LLLGTYHVVGAPPVEWCIQLWPPEED